MTLPRRTAVPRGTTLLKAPRVIDYACLIEGSTGWASVLKKHPDLFDGDALITSTNFSSLQGSGTRWRYQGAVSSPHVHRQLINPDGDLPIFPQGLSDLREYEINAIDLFASGAVISWNIVHNVNGWCCRISNGNDLFEGGIDDVSPYDRTKPIVVFNFFNRAFGGFEDNCGETIIAFNEISGIRDVGMLLNAAGYQCTHNHCFGCTIGTQIGDAENDSAQAYLENHQVETCTIGLLNYGNGTSCMSLLRAYNNTTSIDNYASLHVPHCYITATTGQTGIKMRPSFAGNNVIGGTFQLSGTAIGIHFLPGQATTYNDVTGMYQGGDAGIKCEQEVNYNKWDVRVQDTVIDLREFGQHNQIYLTGNGDIENNTGGALHVDNKFKKNGDDYTPIVP